MVVALIGLVVKLVFADDRERAGRCRTTPPLHELSAIQCASDSNSSMCSATIRSVEK